MCSRTVGATNGASDAVVTEAVPGGEKGRREREKERGYRTKERTKQDDTGRRGRMGGG